MAGEWTRNVHNFFKRNDPYNHPTTGTRSGGVKEFFHEGYQSTDIAAREIYEAQGFPMNSSGTLDSATVHPLEHSYRNYADQLKKLWNGYNKPVIIGETGWDHTYYEPGMPGYVALHHNVLWVSLATGTSMTPFWWAYSGKMNDVIVSNQLMNIRKFTDQIPFSKISNPSPLTVNIQNGDGFGMQSDKFLYGWVVNCKTDVAGDVITLPTIKPGRYKLKMFHTWRGEFVEEKEVEAVNSILEIPIPSFHTKEGHANYVGQDIAFILERIQDMPVARTPKRKK